MFTKTIMLATSVVFVSAQIPNLSASCTSTLTGLVTNSDANTCLNSGALIQLIGATDSSVITPINNWLNGLCSAPACSNATLTTVVTSLTTGCSAEINTFTGGSGTDSASLIPLVLAAYPSARQIVCLKDGNDLCVTKTLTTLEGTFGTLSINRIVSLVSSANATIPTTVSCSNCAKAAYNIAQTSNLNTLVTKENATATCGATFVDGSTPSGIASTVSDSSTTTNTDKNASIGSFGGATSIAALAAAAAMAISSGIAVLI